MKEADYVPYLVLGVIVVLILRSEPGCDRGCKTTLDHLLGHMLPLLLKGA